MPYKCTTLDISAAIVNAPDSKLQLFPANKRIGAVSVTALTAGNNFRLSFGRTQDGILISNLGPIVGIVADEDATQGLFLSVDAAQPGGAAEIMVAWDNTPLKPLAPV